MTYRAGWKYADSAYLIADTLRTSPMQPNTEFSSFGERHEEVLGEHVEEALLKLVPACLVMMAHVQGDQFQLSIHPELMHLLQQPAIEAGEVPPNEGFPIRLNFRTDPGP